MVDGNLQTFPSIRVSVYSLITITGVLIGQLAGLSKKIIVLTNLKVNLSSTTAHGAITTRK